jgi:hypothetical protein
LRRRRLFSAQATLYAGAIVHEQAKEREEQSLLNRLIKVRMSSRRFPASRRKRYFHQSTLERTCSNYYLRHTYTLSPVLELMPLPLPPISSAIARG